MATHDYIISNASGAAVRADLNNALAAIATNNSSATEPTTTYAYQWWADTGSSPTVMKLRNAANSAWITLFQLDGEWTNIAFENGTAAAPSIYFKDSGTDTGIYSPGTDQVGIATAGTARLAVDATGRTLFGTGTTARANLFNTTTTAALQVEGTTVGTSGGLVTLNSADANSPFIAFAKSRGATVGSNTVIQNNDGLGHISFQGSDGTEFVEGASIRAFVDGTPGANDLPTRLVFATTADAGSTPTTRATIDSSGRLLVGVTTARTNFFNATNIGPLLQIEGADTASSSASLVRNSADTSPPSLILAKSRSTGYAVVSSGDALGRIPFMGADGSELVEAALILAEVDGTPGANDMPGRLIFSTTADGASSPTERMRIQADGEINFFDNGATGQNAFRWIRNVGTGTANSGALNLAFNSVNRAPGVTPSALYWDSSTGNITIQTSSAQFKRNILDVTDEQLDKALNLRPCYFQRKEYDYWEYGFIAEEVEDAGLEELVAKVDDKVVSLDYSKISVFCIGLIKKHEEKIESLIAENVALMTRLETLEAKVAALEGA
jgi:hypothetical protein